MSEAEQIEQQRDYTVDPQTGERVAVREAAPDTGFPLVQVCDLDGGYVLALLSRRGDPDGHNMAERCKVRTILSQDHTGLESQIATTLVSDFGLTPDEAAAVAAGEDPVAAAEKARLERERGRQMEPVRGDLNIRQDDSVFGQQQAEHEQHDDRPRDEHGRFISADAEPVREA
jgi:hypothetical protein